jgi:hypothetical protein
MKIEKRAIEEDYENEFSILKKIKLTNQIHQFDSFAGKIDSIYLENFKCHSKLKIEFGPYINFITGRNGSMYVYYNLYYNNLSYFMNRWQKFHNGSTNILFWWEFNYNWEKN